MKKALAMVARIKQMQAAKLAIQELRTKSEPAPEADNILDYQVLVSPTLKRADHFRLFAGRIEETLHRAVRCAFAAPPQHGKAVAVETPMLTDRGWVPAGEVRLGDRLVGSDGNWTKVTGVFPQGVKPLNRVSFRDGATLDVCDEHLWSVRHGASSSVVRTTNELRSDIFYGGQAPRVPVVGALDPADIGEPLDKYPRLIRAIDRIGEGEAVCFSVDASDHLFCAGRDLVVTHNTQTTLHGLLWLIKNAPERRHAYITYNLTRARKVARLFRHLLLAAKIPFSGTLDCIELPGGGQVIFTSIDAGLTGEPVDGVAIIDDPYSGPKDSESKARRLFVEECYRQVIVTRVHPKASILLLATRWHPQDLTGTLKGEGWEFINLPAIAEEDDANGREVGEALFPEERPLDWLLVQQREVGEYAWAALYQGRPRPKGGKVFHEPTFYTELPANFRGGFGVDLAYTERSNADWSICVELWREDRGLDDKGKPVPPLFYVKHVDRAQVELPAFSKLLKLRHAARKAWKMLWRGSGTEKGSASLLRERGIPLIVQQPPGDKFVSAQNVAAAWNDGRVLVPDTETFPETEKWVIPFLGVVGDFTGSNKEVDDDVDGLGNAHHLLRGEAYVPPSTDKKKKRSELRNLAGF